jgi:prepilin-type N-terminal cleavage/methylation domain-containing protein
VLIMRTQRGFTLIELLISLVILSVVTGSLFMLITTSQRVSRAQTERTTLQSIIRAWAIVIPSELRQINAIAGAAVPAVQNDIISALANPSTSITFRAMRGVGFLCQPLAVGATQLVVSAEDASWTGVRAPANTDGAYVFDEGADPDTGDDDSWAQVQITNAVTGTACPGATSSYTLTFVPAAVTAATVNAPVRTFEVMQMGLHPSGGEFWLGARSISAGEAALQPVLGPLTNDGLEFNFYDGAGVLTTNPGLVKSVEVTLKGLTDQPIVVGANTKTAYVRDSLVTRVVLRNTLR